MGKSRLRLLAEAIVDDESLYVDLYDMVENVRRGHCINQAARTRAILRAEELIRRSESAEEGA